MRHASHHTEPALRGTKRAAEESSARKRLKGLQPIDWAAMMLPYLYERLERGGDEWTDVSQLVSTQSGRNVSIKTVTYRRNANLLADDNLIARRGVEVTFFVESTGLTLQQVVNRSTSNKDEVSRLVHEMTQYVLNL